MRAVDDFFAGISPFEFHKCTPKCTQDQMDKNFLEKLEAAYRLYPFTLSSAYRSVAYEKERGRRGTSAHCKGRAVDIPIRTSCDRFYIMDSLRRVGFNRFGIGKNFIHVDDDVCATRPANCIFLDGI